MELAPDGAIRRRSESTWETDAPGAPPPSGSEPSWPSSRPQPPSPRGSSGGPATQGPRQANRRALFASERELRTLPPGSPQAVWLESMLDAVDGGCLWILPDLLPHADRQYLRASDLAFVHDLAVRVRQELDRQSPERRGAPEHVRRLRGLLGELADRIAPRR